MQYYGAFMDGKMVSVGRADHKSGCYESYRDGSWVDNPELIEVTGIGGTTPYEEISKAEADKFIKSKKRVEDG